ncbi:MAG: glyoxalase [Gelidibacter sp.]|nr:glyoxalase [Gelidibacter sp.]
MTIKKDIKSRPIINKALVSEIMTSDEKFQNATLRPIIKMKHELLIAYFEHYLAIQKFDFNELSELKKIAFIERAFSKDIQFRSEVKGMIIGHFTLEEFSMYKNFLKESNKRILNIVKERVLSTLTS